MMSKNLSNIVLVFFFSLLLTQACTERIEIELDESQTRLVVDGHIGTDTTTYIIRLTSSSGYFSNQLPPPVSGARLYLDDGVNLTQLGELPDHKGHYVTPSDYHGIPGRTYTLEINLDEPVGERDYYVAQTHMPKTEFVLDSIQLELQERFDFWILNLYAYDPPTTDFYKFDVKRNGIALTDTAYRSTTIDDRLINGNRVEGLGVVFLYKDEVMPGDTLHFIMSSIPKGYFDFFNELRSESGFSNPLFSGPPANISSNLEEGGLGYFAAFKSKQLTYIVPDSLFR